MWDAKEKLFASTEIKQMFFFLRYQRQDAIEVYKQVVLAYHSALALCSSKESRWPSSRFTANASTELSLERRKQRDRMSPTAGPPAKCQTN